MIKRMMTLLLAAALCLSLAACTGTDTKKEREILPVTGDMDIAVLQVGKADAIVVTTATKTMVIDAGETDDGGKVLNYLNEIGRAAIDYLVITHYDRDHVGGADRLLSFCEIGQVIRPDYVGEREEYDNFMASLAGLEITDTAMAAGAPDMTFMMDDVQVTVDGPMKAAYVNGSGVQQDNNFSLVVKLHHGSQVALLTGDCEDERLAELITADTDWSADFLKVPYHGNYTQLTATFFKEVSPAYAVACDSKKNPTAEETKAALAAAGAKFYSTVDGTVRCHSDGTALTVTQG